MSSDNAATSSLYANSLLIIMLIGTVFTVVGFFRIELPFNEWLSAYVPAWVSIVISIMIGILFIMLALPNISALPYLVIWLVLVVFMIAHNAIYKKALLWNSTIPIVAFIIHVLIKKYFRKSRTDS